MKPKWSHPKLGTFKYGVGEWTALVHMLAFKAFEYDTGFSNSRRPTDMFELSFRVHVQDEEPSVEATALACLLLANQNRLVEEIVEALWDDFHGKGPGSRMWWNGNLDEVLEAIVYETNDKQRLSKATDLYKYLMPCRVCILQLEEESPSKVVDISFHAAFEREHGLSILTDGKGVLGLGYMGEVSPFGS